MFVYETINKLDEKHEIITAKTLIELCGSVLEYYNGAKDDKELDYTVTFMNSEGEIVIEITEKNLRFALHGANENEKVTDEMSDASSEFWNMKPNGIEIIAFNNPCRFGEATWDNEYTEDNDEESDDDYLELTSGEINQNLLS